jgi:soluble P-type ATPase
LLAEELSAILTTSCFTYPRWKLKAMADEKGIEIQIPGFWKGANRIKAVFSDYTGTLSLEGKLIKGVKGRLRRLAEMVHIYVVTSDTRGTAEKELRAILGSEHLTIQNKLSNRKPHDEQKLDYLGRILREKNLKKCEVAVFGNGRNDRKWLKVIKDEGLAIAVDVGEGCAIEALNNATIFASNINNALDLLLDPKRSVATLRTLGNKASSSGKRRT